jgi:hypothetical protein
MGRVARLEMNRWSRSGSSEGCLMLKGYVTPRRFAEKICHKGTIMATGVPHIVGRVKYKTLYCDGY